MKTLGLILLKITGLSLLKDFYKSCSDLYQDIKNIDFWDSVIGWTIKLYSLTLVIPFAGSALFIIWKILGQESRYTFFKTLWKIWSDFYITGSFLDISAWRWQILLIIFSFIFVATQKD
jgi:hypothetical protein